MAVSSVVGVFETVVAVLPIVMCFQSLILDMAGNVGTQSLAVTIRVLVDETLTAKQKLQPCFERDEGRIPERTFPWNPFLHIYRTLHLCIKTLSNGTCIFDFRLRWIFPDGSHGNFQYGRHFDPNVFPQDQN